MSNKIEPRTVTIPLEEYLVMKENAETLSKALHERKVVYTGNGMGSFHHYFIADDIEVVNKVRAELLETTHELNRKTKELNELTKRHKDTVFELQNRFSSLSITFDEYTEASLWTRIMRIFNRQY